MIHTTNYYDTFIEVAEDCPVQASEVPPRDKPTVANAQYDILAANPYKYTSDDVLFDVYAKRNNFPQVSKTAERQEFFSKGQPCFRSSPLTKRYGWGVHSNSEGQIALFGLESSEYERLAHDTNIKHLKAMRSKRAI